MDETNKTVGNDNQTKNHRLPDDVTLDKDNPSRGLLKKNKLSVDFKTISYNNDEIQEIIATSNFTVNDVTITFKEEKIPANKSILAASCEYFELRLQPHFRDAKSEHLNIEFDVSVATFKHILGYLQTGTIQLSTGNLVEVTKTANFLLLEDLKKFCLGIYKQNIDCHSVNFAHTFADEYLFGVVSTAAFTFKVKQFEAVWRSCVFHSWKIEYIQDILCSDLVVVSEEKKILKFLFEWLTADYEKRGEHATGLLHNIRYSFLTMEDLNEVAEGNKYDQLARKLFEIYPKFADEETLPRIYHKGVYMIGKDSNNEVKFERYWPEDGTVKILQPPAQFYVNRFRIVVNNDKIYAIGCKSGSCHVYDPLKDIWIARASISTCNFFWLTTACSFGDEIFAFYSCDNYNKGNVKQAGVVYCEKTNMWRPLPVETPTDRDIESATRCGDSIYLVPYSPTIGKVLQYTPSTYEWTAIPFPTTQRARYAVSAYKSKLIFVQSYTSNSFPPTNRVLVFCTTLKCSMNLPTCVQIT